MKYGYCENFLDAFLVDGDIIVWETHVLLLLTMCL